MATISGPTQRDIQPPTPKWSDPIVHWLRTNVVLVAIYVWVTRHLVPFLFALLIALPVGLLIFPLFIPKFIRNAKRRRKYEVFLAKDRINRVHGTSAEGSLAQRGRERQS